MSDETFVATTDENGVATFEDLPPGEYEVTGVTPSGDYDIEEVENA